MNWQLKAAAAAGILGLAVLAASFRSYWPATSWTVLPREQLIEKGRVVAATMGVDVKNWQASDTVRLSKPLAFYTTQHPRQAQSELLSPLYLRITYRARDGGGSAEVGFNSAGKLTYWRPPKNFKGTLSFDSGELAAKSAFEFVAGKEASSYENAGRRMGEEAHEETYTWKRRPAPNSDLRQTISVDTKDSLVKSVEARANISSVDDDSEAGDKTKYWEVLSAIFQLICVVGTVLFIGIYVLWLARKVISHNFPIRVAVVSWLMMIAAGLLQSRGSASGINFFSTFFLAITILCLVAVGRGISEAGRPKWMSLEQLFRLAPLAKPTGSAVGSGLATGSMLAAVPFLIAACGLFPHSWVLPHNAELLYSRSPLIDAIDASTYVLLIGFFGFGLPAVDRLARMRKLRWLIIVPIGSVFFANEPPLVSGPLAAPLTAGLLTLGVFWFLWRYFDLLAVLVAQLTSSLLIAMLLLQQKGVGFGSLAAALISIGLAAAWFLWRGQEMAEGDPRASVPALGGFRAEREKLRAEFSVAARAQRDMLPRTPPHIPGYTVAASCTPSLDVGGDLYDFLVLTDGRIGIGVGDVSGKGVPAALYMTLTKGLLAAVTKNSSELASVVEEVNRHLHGVTRKKVFVTMVLGFLDTEQRLLQCARAGHNPVVWRRKLQESTELVTPGGLGLGITASRVFAKQLQVAEMQLGEGDAVVFYSDGITEAMNSSLEQFGEQRLMTAVEKADNLDAAATRDSILDEVKMFLGGVHPQDDMTLVVLRVGGVH